MPLSTTQYGYLIDPMVPFTDDHGQTIKDGFLKVFIAGSSTPVLTYANYDGTLNPVVIELDNSGRCKTKVIVDKSLSYKVVVYDKDHSHENPILTVDNFFAIGASVTVENATIGLQTVQGKTGGYVGATVAGDTVTVGLSIDEAGSAETEGGANDDQDDYIVPLISTTSSAQGKHLPLSYFTQTRSLVSYIYKPSGKSYAKGEYCWHDGQLRKAKQAITAPSGSFDSSKWDTVTAAEEIEELFEDKVSEAPEDDKIYARKNGVWIEIVAGVNDIIVFDIYPNISDIVSAAKNYKYVLLQDTSYTGLKELYVLANFKENTFYEFKALRGSSSPYIHLIDGVLTWDWQDDYDSALSDSSKNAAQNKAVYAAISSINAVIPSSASSSNKLGLDSDIGRVGGSIAPSYDSLTFPIAEGSLCMYARRLYTCTEPGGIPTSENWTAGHWTQTRVSDIIGNVEQLLAAL